jgi:putative ABC transport system permease protein
MAGAQSLRANGRSMVNPLMQDIRFALRQLKRSPGFAAIVVLTLSLGIGAATAVFSVIDAAMLRPLPFAHQERLVFPDTTALAGYQQPWSYLSYVDARRDVKTFAALAGYSDFYRINLEAQSGPVSLRAVKGTDNFFDVFGVKPLLGRTYRPGEDQPGRDDVAVLSYEVWQTQFGGKTDAVGKVVRLDGEPYTVIGVMPAGFRFPLSVRDAIYTPLHVDPRWKNSRGSHWMRTVGLLKDGVSREQAHADFVRVLADLGRAYPTTDTGRTVHVIPLASQMIDKADGPLKTLLLAVLALLAIACVNVAGLLLARGVKREREMALRAAVGAGRARLVRQMITESMVLAVAGLVGGVVLSWALLAAMRVFLVDALARGVDVQMNMMVLLVALGFSALTSVLASLAPAFRLAGADPNRALRAGGGAGTGAGQHRLRSAFVVTQVALSLVLLVVSGLLLRNLRGLMQTNPGVDSGGILATQIDLSRGGYEGRDPLVAFYRPLLERVSHLPGVQAAGVINILPVQGWGSNSDVHITGQPPYPPNVEMLAETRMVSAGYFDAMGIKLVRGRMLSPAQDMPDLPAGSVVVNEAFRRRFFSGGGDPVGAHIDDNDDNDKVKLKTGIVGMVTDVRQNLRQPPLAEMDYLIDQLPSKDRLDYLANMVLVVRTSGDSVALVPSLRSAVHGVDATVPFRTPETMTQVISQELVFERMESWLFGIFAGFALLLAVVGLYGLINHEVELRTREIGIRMALGSSRGLVMGNVLRRVALLLVTGVGTGWVMTLALQKVLAAVVVMRAGQDTVLLGGLTAALIGVGLMASVVPARKAATIEPMQALRNE